MKTIDSEMISLPIIGQDRSREENVKVILSETTRGREVRGVHHRDGERIGSYPFRVTDEEWKICAYRNDNDPPIGVVQAVEKFGYNVENAGSYPLEYINRQYNRHILDAILSNYSMSSAPLLKGFLSHGKRAVATVDLSYGIIHQGSDGSENKNISLNADKVYHELEKVATDGGDLTSEKITFDDLTPIGDWLILDKDVAQRDIDPILDLELEVVNGNQKVLVTIFDEDHVDRYTFDIINTDEKKCVVQGVDSGGRPPIEVINKVIEAGYTIMNMGVPHPDQPLYEQLNEAAHLLDDLSQSHDEKNPLYQSLAHGKNSMKNAAIVAMIREMIRSPDYERVLSRAIRKSPLVDSTKELESPPPYPVLDDFLRDYFPHFIPQEVIDEIEAFYDGREIF